MGHTAGKDVFRRLGDKIDGLHLRAPWNETFRALLEELLSSEEADLIVRMPNMPSALRRVAAITRADEKTLRPMLERLCEKGLVIDLFIEGEYRYSPSPLIVGWFEFTMMRSGPESRAKDLAPLFHEYLADGSFYEANFYEATQVSIARAVPHIESLGDHVEVLDYEKVEHLIDEADRYAVGLCACRHKEEHSAGRECDTPLETCVTLDKGAEYVVRHGMGREISQSEARDIFARSAELGLVFCADNVRNGPQFVCHCCGCCCTIMNGLNVHGLPTTLVTSTLIAQVDVEACAECGHCAEACPVRAIRLKSDADGSAVPTVDESFCIGCGVCGLNCPTGAIRLVKRDRRVIHPETTFERVILQCLERGTLQNQLFDNPQSLTQKVMRPLLGGFLRLGPVKRALMSDMLRSRFLSALDAGVVVLGKGYVRRI